MILVGPPMDEEVDGKSGLAGFTGEGKVWSNRSRHRMRGCLASEPSQRRTPASDAAGRTRILARQLTHIHVSRS